MDCSLASMSISSPALSTLKAGHWCSPCSVQRTQVMAAALARDADELSELCSHLMAKSRVDALAIVGHSTGCQDAVTLLRVAPPEVRSKIRAAVLQAPVSDREADSLEPDPKVVPPRSRRRRPSCGTARAARC